MKKKNNKYIFMFIALLLIPFYFGINNIKAATGTWVGDYCTSCGSYGSAGTCDKVKYTKVGLFRVSFYINGEKVGSSVNVSSSEEYKTLAQNARLHWGDGKTDIVSYANGTTLTANEGGIDSIVIGGLTTSNVQRVLSPAKNPKNVNKILQAAGIDPNILYFSKGKIYYKAKLKDGVCEDDYQIQMVVEAMQVITWLCETDESGKTKGITWVGTPYELNNGLLKEGYNSKSGGNGWFTGSIVDRDLLSALRLNKEVEIGSVKFSSVADCLSVHIRGYDVTKGYGMNVYNITGEVKIDCDEGGGPPSGGDGACTYKPGDGFDTACCDDEDYLKQYFESGATITFEEACCEIPIYLTKYSEYTSEGSAADIHKKYCEPEEKCKPLKVNGEAECEVADCDGSKNVSIFKDPIFKGKDNPISKLITIDPTTGNIDTTKLAGSFSAEELEALIAVKDDTFTAVAQQGETYRENIGTYCDLYCQEIAAVILPDVYPAANAGRYFQWYISTNPNNLIEHKVVKICAEDIKLDDFIADYYAAMETIQKEIDFYANHEYYYCTDTGGYDAPSSSQKITQIDSISDFVVGGEVTAEHVCDSKYNDDCCDGICGPEPICTCVCDPGSAPEGYTGAPCGWMSDCINACKRRLDEWNKCMSETGPNCTAGMAKANNSCKNGGFVTQTLKAKSEFQTKGKNTIALFEEYLKCFDKRIGTDIYTDFEFDMISSGLDMRNFADYQISEKKEGPYYSNANCVDSRECDQSYFTYLPEIAGLDSKELAKMTCYSSGFASTDLLTESERIRKKYNDECTKFAESQYLRCGNTGPYGSGNMCVPSYQPFGSFYGGTESKKPLGDKEFEEAKEFCLSKYVAILSRLRKNSVPNLIEKAGSSIASTGLLPLEVNNFKQGGIWSYGGTYGGASTSTIVQKARAGGYCDTSGDDGDCALILDSSFKENEWWSTFRLIAQVKDESYSLNDEVNACVCSDGTVMDLENVKGTDTWYCPCDPERVSSSYSSSESSVDASIVETATWGKCKYSGYIKNSEGGTEKVTYNTGSGVYKLAIKYYNIGTIDSDGTAHFDDILGVCSDGKCTSDGCTYEGEYCKIIIGNTIMTDSWSNENLENWSYKSSYFVCTEYECPPEPCKPGKCPPSACDPSPTCSGDKCCPKSCGPEGCPDPSGLAIIYRTVDLDNPFPGGNPGTVRKAGANWVGSETRITENRGVDGNGLYYSSEVKPLYKFKLTPSIIKQIRQFNTLYGHDYASSSTIAYPIDTDTGDTKIGIIGDDSGNYNAGISQILRNDITKIFATEAASAGEDTEDYILIPIKEVNCPTDKDGNKYCTNITKTIGDYYKADECWQLAQEYLGGGK